MPSSEYSTNSNKSNTILVNSNDYNYNNARVRNVQIGFKSSFKINPDDEFKSYQTHLNEEIETLKQPFLKLARWMRKYRCLKRKLKIFTNCIKFFTSKLKPLCTRYLFYIFLIFLIYGLYKNKGLSYDVIHDAIESQNLNRYSISCTPEELIEQDKWLDVDFNISSYDYHINYLKSYYEHYQQNYNNSKKGLNMCNCKLVGHCFAREPPKDMFIFTNNFDFDDFQKLYMFPLQSGGYWKPPKCANDFNSRGIESKIDRLTIIIIPFLNRYNNLREILYNLHPFLQRQYVNYRIVVVEQSNSDISFNKGRLYNAAFNFLSQIYQQAKNSNKKSRVKLKKNLNLNEIQKNILSVHNGREARFECMILHDVDLLPEHDYNIYECDKHSPRHLSLSIRHEGSEGYYKNLYELLVGGVLALRPKIYEKINGFSNEYWKWGAEDDGNFIKLMFKLWFEKKTFFICLDLAIRMLAKKVCVKRPSEFVSLYKMSNHKPSQRNPLRLNLLFSSVERQPIDGVSNLYELGVEVTDVKFYNLFTHIKVDVKEPDANYAEKYGSFSLFG